MPAIADLMSLFSGMLPQIGQARRTRTPVLFSDIEDRGQFYDFPFNMIKIDKSLPADMVNQTMRHELTHEALRNTGVPQPNTPAWNQISQELRMRGYNESPEVMRDEGLAHTISDPSFAKLSPELRQRFIDDSLNTLRLKGKDTKKLESLLKP